MKTRTSLRGSAVLAVWFSLVRLLFAAQTPGSVDSTFQSAYLDAKSPINVMLLQRDGRLVVDSAFGIDWFGGPGIVRMNADGTVDPTFNSYIGAYGVSQILEMPDSSLLVAGAFSSFNGEPHNGLLRLNSDGTTDYVFAPPFLEGTFVRAAALQSDGKVLVGGGIALEGTNAALVRLHGDGSIDSSFAPAFDDSVNAILVETNRIVVGGNFYTANGVAAPHLAAVHYDGTLDTNFVPALDQAPSWVNALLRQADGKIFVSGDFTISNVHRGILRLNPNGSLDESFQVPAEFDDHVSAMQLQLDGKLVVAHPMWGTNQVLRLLPTGAADTNFICPALGGDWPGINALAIQTNGQILVGGQFDGIGGSPLRQSARLNGDTPSPLPTLEFSPAHIVVSETRTSVVATLMRLGETSGATTLSYGTVDDSALAGRDYASIAGDLRFATGESNKTIEIPIFDNRLVDGSRTFSLLLSNVLGGEFGSNTTATITITDNEVNNRVQFSAARFPVKETQSNALVEVVRDFGSTGAVSVRYDIRNGSARRDVDFKHVSGTVNFASGQFTNWFLVPLINTRRAEGNRYATLSLFDPRNGAVLGAQSNATLAILDEESPAVIVAPIEAFLRAAVFGGGNVIFDIDGIVAMNQPLDITASTTLDARGHNVLLSGENVTRLFNVATGATLTLRGLTLANGLSANAGAIWNDGTLVLIDCTFSNNIARGADGTNGVDGPLSEGQTHDGTPGQDARGGAIVNNGKLFATNSAFIANAAIAGTGGNGGTGAFVTNYFGGGGEGGNGSSGGNAIGGALYSSGFVSIKSCAFGSNFVLAGTGGSGNVGALTNFSSYFLFQATPGLSAVGGNASGGAIALLSEFVVSSCSFEQNSALAGRGGDGATGYAYRGRASTSAAGPGQAGAAAGTSTGGALFVSAAGKIEGTSLNVNSTLGADGGNGGGGGTSGDYGTGGTGGPGGDGGHARGGAIFSTVELFLMTNSFRSNSARAGNGGYGGGGARAGTWGGNGGPGGFGGRGGNAEAGALVMPGGSISANVLVENQSLGGNGGGGGSGGSFGGTRYTSAGTGGKGGAGGTAQGGATCFPIGVVAVSASTFQGNLSLSGAGGGGGVGPNACAYNNTFGPTAGGGGGGGDAGAAFGGAIASSAAVDLLHSIFISNRVEAGAAGSGASGGSCGYARSGGYPGNANTASGGAVWSDSEFSSTDCTYLGNAAVAGAGGHGGSGGRTTAYDPDGSRFTRGAGGSSGGLASGGALVLVSNYANIIASSFTENSVHGGNGGSAGSNGSQYNNFGASPQGGAGGDARGGAIETLDGNLSLRDSSFSRNYGMSGNAGTTGPASYLRYRGVTAFSGAPGGMAAGAGVSIISGTAAVSGCTFDLNSLHAGTGGTGGTRLWSTVNGGEGGIGGASFGGGIALNDGALALTNSTFYSNSVIGGLGGTGGANNGGAPGGIGGDASGGAIHSVTGTVVLVNASFAENLSGAGLGGSGGAGETNTIGATGASGNALGGTLANNEAQFLIVNSLFKHHAGNTNAFGSFVDLGNNFSSDTTFAFSEASSFNNIDPLVGKLTDNGGPTRTLALLSGSPAIDAGNDSVCPRVDQRGVPRPFGAHCDIGAYELNQPTFSISGRVQERDGVPGVIVSAGPANATTDMDGVYTIRNLFAGSYAVTPQYSGTEFLPDIRTISMGPSATNVNFTIKLSRAALCFQCSEAGPLLHVRGLPMASYTLESSTNLIHWESFMNARMDFHGACELRTIVNTNEPHRYFRVR